MIAYVRSSWWASRLARHPHPLSPRHRLGQKQTLNVPHASSLHLAKPHPPRPWPRRSPCTFYPHPHVCGQFFSSRELPPCSREVALSSSSTSIWTQPWAKTLGPWHTKSGCWASRTFPQSRSAIYSKRLPLPPFEIGDFEQMYWVRSLSS